MEDDTCIEILTLGLLGKLRKVNGITALNVDKRIPCNRITICAWEQCNGISLPADLKEFYASTDGFLLTWKYQYDGEEGENLIANGELKIYALSNVRRLNFVHQRKQNGQGMLGYCSVGKSSSLCDFESNRCQNCNLSVAFILSHHHDVGTICLVYHPENEQNQNFSTTKPLNHSSSIWLLDMANSWHFLANDFSSYFRMMLVHVGLDHWQLKFTSSGLTTSCRRIMATLIPHLLQQQDSENNNFSSEYEIPRNVINSNIFKIGSASTSKMCKVPKVNSKSGGITNSNQRKLK